MKRILSLIICLVSILTVALPVYAAEDGVNIEGVTDGEESAAEGEGPATEDDIVQEPEVLAAPVVSSVNYTDFQTVKISWSGVDGADGYYVFRKNEGEEAWRNIGDTANTSFTDAKAFDGGKFYYYVQGYRITEGEKIAGEFNIPESYIYSKLSSPSIKSLIMPSSSRSVICPWA